jgi:hypothetical protein
MVEAKTLQLAVGRKSYSALRYKQEHPAVRKLQPASESMESPTAAKGFEIGKVKR